jgi:capsular polysaccharide biosynthesis protein
MNLRDLRCKSIEAHGEGITRVTELSGIAEGLAVFEVPDVVFVPKYRIQSCLGFVPKEAIHYSSHLSLAQRPIVDGDEEVDIGTITRCDANVCILGNVAAKNFGHWTEELLKVIVLEASGFDGAYVIAAGLPTFCTESLEVLGIPEGRIVTALEPVIYSAGTFVRKIHHLCADRYPKVILALQERLHAATEMETGLGERIWLERGVATRTSRKIVNEEEVHACLEQYGFTRVDLAEYSFRKQIGIDRQLDIMAGPHGSGFVHCGFMRPGRHIVEIFSPEYINPSVIQLCLAMRHRYNQIVPTHQPHWPYTFGKEILVDVSHLRLAFSFV